MNQSRATTCRCGPRTVHKTHQDRFFIQTFCNRFCNFCGTQTFKNSFGTCNIDALKICLKVLLILSSTNNHTIATIIFTEFQIKIIITNNVTYTCLDYFVFKYFSELVNLNIRWVDIVP